jgi:hypothetical protein
MGAPTLDYGGKTVEEVGWLGLAIMKKNPSYDSETVASLLGMSVSTWRQIRTIMWLASLDFPKYRSRVADAVKLMNETGSANKAYDSLRDVMNEVWPTKWGRSQATWEQQVDALSASVAALETTATAMEYVWVPVLTEEAGADLVRHLNKIVRAVKRLQERVKEAAS